MSSRPRSADLTVVTISPVALSTIEQLARDSRDGRETGGILLGHENPARIEITTAGAPGPEAVRTPSRFCRDLAYSQELARRAYATDRAVWVGEWHTHPGGPAHPSAVDLRTYQAILADPELFMTVFIAIIVGPILKNHPDPPAASLRRRESPATTPTQAWVIDTAGALHTSAFARRRKWTASPKGHEAASLSRW